MENRKSDIEKLKIPSWNEVVNREYEEWNKKLDEERYEIWTDNMESAFDNCLKVICEKLNQQT